MTRSARTPLGRARRFVQHVVLDQSREGRAAEIAAWSNAASAVAVAALVTYLGWQRLPFHAAWLGVGSGALALVLLRLALAHRLTVWMAAAVGTLTVAAVGGGLAWLFAHVLEIESAPQVCAVVGALLASAAPAWSYAHLAGRRARDVRDSLVDPVSVPSSR